MEKKLAIRSPPPSTRRRQKANQDQSMDRNDLKDGEQQKQANASVESLLHELYYDPRHASAYTSIGNVYRAAKKLLPNLKRNEVERWFQRQLTATLHKPVRLRFPTNKVIVMSIDDQWQCDLADMSSKAEYNDGYTFILTCIDCFSKYAWAIPIINKQADSIIKALKIILKSGRKPKRLQTDKGTEFLNRKVQTFLRHHNIQLFTTQSDKKASIVERFNRTMKGRTYKYFTAKNTYRYVDVLQLLVDGYNNSYHRSIKMKPNSVRKRHQMIIRQRLYGKLKSPTKLRTQRKKSYKYIIGDLVRIIKQRLTFARGYLPNWSEEIFIVYNRKNFKEPFYYLRDFAGEDIEGGFYEKELQQVQDSDEYRIEKVLRRKRVNGKQLHLVKWKGWPNKFNSWVENIRNL